MDIYEVLRATNWPLLIEQKQTLAQFIKNEHMEGLLNWIDAIQDAADDAGLIGDTSEP